MSASRVLSCGRRIDRREAVPRYFPFATDFLKDKQPLIGLMSFTAAFDDRSAFRVGPREGPVRSHRHDLLDLELDVEFYHLEEPVIGFAHVFNADE